MLCIVKPQKSLLKDGCKRRSERSWKIKLWRTTEKKISCTACSSESPWLPFSLAEARTIYHKHRGHCVHSPFLSLFHIFFYPYTWYGIGLVPLRWPNEAFFMLKFTIIITKNQNPICEGTFFFNKRAIGRNFEHTHTHKEEQGLGKQ